MTCNPPSGTATTSGTLGIIFGLVGVFACGVIIVGVVLCVVTGTFSATFGVGGAAAASGVAAAGGGVGAGIGGSAAGFGGVSGGAGASGGAFGSSAVPAYAPFNVQPPAAYTSQTQVYNPFRMVNSSIPPR